MLLIAKYLGKLFAILNGEVSPRQIAAGFALGVLIGIASVKGLLPLLLLLIALIINVNLAMLFLAAAIFKIISYAFDPLANSVGYALLVKVPPLKGLWTALYTLPLVPYTNFNNTIVLGSVVIGLVLLIPMYFLAKVGVVNYRARWRQKVLAWKIVKIIQASSFYKFYLSYRSFRGDA
jgi:uncharacterized protein (TIGR03546 family)